MRRLLAAVIASGAIAALAGPLSSSAGAAYRGTYFWGSQVYMSGPEYISDAAAMDGNVACAWMAGQRPENNRAMNPCVDVVPKDVCFTATNIYGEYFYNWICGYQAEAAWLNVYGYMVVWSFMPYSGAAIFSLTNYG